MLRIFISYILPLVLPTVIYLAWAIWVRKKIAATHPQTVASGEADEITAAEMEPYVIRTPWFRLILAGAVLMLVSLVLSVFLSPKNPPDSVYQPPRVENGQVVPGQYAPKPN